MKFIYLLFREAGDARGWIAFMSILPGIGQGILIAVVSTAADNGKTGGLQFQLLGIFAISCAISLFSINRALNATNEVIESYLESNTEQDDGEGPTFESGCLRACRPIADLYRPEPGSADDLASSSYGNQCGRGKPDATVLGSLHCISVYPSVCTHGGPGGLRHLSL